jgi:putative membrane protein
MKISLALHLIGVVMSLGGVLFISRFMALALNDSGLIESKFANAIARSYKIWAVWGLGLLLVTGLYQIFYMGIAYYMKQGWFHTKLLFILGLIALVFFLGRACQRAVAGEHLAKGTLMAIHGSAGLVLLFSVFLTLLGR